MLVSAESHPLNDSVHIGTARCGKGNVNIVIFLKIKIQVNTKFSSEQIGDLLREHDLRKHAMLSVYETFVLSCENFFNDLECLGSSQKRERIFYDLRRTNVGARGFRRQCFFILIIYN